MDERRRCTRCSAETGGKAGPYPSLGIIMGELRGGEALSWLRAVGTGHPGSITTIHANSPEGAIEQLALMALMARTELRRAELVAYVAGVVVQLGRASGR